MKKIQNERYNMLLAVQNHFDSNPAIWSSNIPVSEIKTAFSAKLEEIYQAGLVQRIDSTGATLAKAELRGILEEKGYFVSSVLKAYTNINPGHDLLYKRLQITRSRFAKLRENDLLVAIDDLDAAAALIIESLTPFGVTQATLDGLMAARAAFYNDMNRPDEVAGNRRNATALIAQLLKEAIVMLDGRMDPVMEIFRRTERQFFSVYYNDRKIHHTATRTISLEVTTVNAADKTPLAEAQIEVVGAKIKRISSKKGLNRVKNLKEGNYTLSVSHPDFISQMIPFTIVTHETTEIVAKLEKIVAKGQSFKGAEEVAEVQRIKDAEVQKDGVSEDLSALEP